MGEEGAERHGGIGGDRRHHVLHRREQPEHCVDGGRRELRDPVEQGLDQRASSTTTAMTASPSPRPMKPMPSFVFAFTLTAPASTPSRAASAADMAPTCGCQLRELGDDRAVRLREREPAAADELMGGAQELHRVRVLPLRIAIGKQLADVARAGGAEDGVGQRVRDRVGIRVAGQALRVRNGDAAQDERAARDEAVGVVADPHARQRRDRLLDDAVVLAAPHRLVAGVADQAVDLLQRGAVGGAGRRDDVLLHHEAAVVVGAEAEGHLPHLVSHRDPRGLQVRHVVEHDAAHGEHAEVGHRVGLLVVRHARRALGLQGPADEGREAAGAGLDLAHAVEMLDAILVALAETVHHGDRGLHALAVRLLLHAQPFLGLRLLLRDPLADPVHEDLAAAARNAVEPRRLELADHVRHAQAEPLAEEHDLGRREAVDVDRVMALDVAHQVEVPLERDVRVVAALEQDLDAADRLALVDLGADLLEAQHIALIVLGPAIERAELAVGDADVGVVDVAVDDVGDDRVRVLPPALGVGQLAELEERGALVELQMGLEFT